MRTGCAFWVRKTFVPDRLRHLLIQCPLGKELLKTLPLYISHVDTIERKIPCHWRTWNHFPVCLNGDFSQHSGADRGVVPISAPRRLDRQNVVDLIPAAQIQALPDRDGQRQSAPAIPLGKVNRKVVILLRCQ